MKKGEFEKKVKKFKITKVGADELAKSFAIVKGDYYMNHNKLNIYGCFVQEKEYVIFFKDSERGIVKELGRFKKEDEAYDKLFEIVESWESESQKVKK